MTTKVLQVQSVLYIRRFNQQSLKNTKKKISRKFQKAKVEFACNDNYLYSIFIVLGIIGNLEMV